jgi:hypothetical protein
VFHELIADRWSRHDVCVPRECIGEPHRAAPLEIDIGTGTGTIDLTLDIGPVAWDVINTALNAAVGDGIDTSCTMEPFEITLVTENVCE